MKSFINYIVESRTQKSYDSTNISEIEEKFSKMPKSSGIKFMRMRVNNDCFVVEVKENGIVPFVNKQSIKEIAQKILQDYQLDGDIIVSSQMRNEDSYDIGFKIK